VGLCSAEGHYQKSQLLYQCEGDPLRVSLKLYMLHQEEQEQSDHRGASCFRNSFPEQKSTLANTTKILTERPTTRCLFACEVRDFIDTTSLFFDHVTALLSYKIHLVSFTHCKFFHAWTRSIQFANAYKTSPSNGRSSDQSPSG
jgi:hypothetical protein